MWSCHTDELPRAANQPACLSCDARLQSSLIDGRQQILDRSKRRQTGRCDSSALRHGNGRRRLDHGRVKFRARLFLSQRTKQVWLLPGEIRLQRSITRKHRQRLFDGITNQLAKVYIRSCDGKRRQVAGGWDCVCTHVHAQHFVVLCCAVLSLSVMY